jgi:hypothetical protein
MLGFARGPDFDVHQSPCHPRLLLTGLKAAQAECG